MDCGTPWTRGGWEGGAESNMASLLEVRSLRTFLATPAGLIRAVDGVDLSMDEGDARGLVGESGAGKTMLALSIMGLLPDPYASVQPGSSIRYRGQELVRSAPSALRRLWGKEMAMVFQEPLAALNPVLTVGEQVEEAVVRHTPYRGARGRERVHLLLEEVGFPDPHRAARSYPHQLSGGLRRRAMLAVALAGEPKLLLADEPTAGLDAIIQLQVLNLLQDLQARRGMALLLISHDLDVVARVTQRTAVLYAGQVVEEGPTSQVLARPLHPYTKGLVEARISLHRRRRKVCPIPGEPPSAADWPAGCRFHPRCPDAMARCKREEPSPFPMAGHTWGAPQVHWARCWLFEGG